jgi:hypothetical protein
MEKIWFCKPLGTLSITYLNNYLLHTVHIKRDCTAELRQCLEGNL